MRTTARRAALFIRAFIVFLLPAPYFATNVPSRPPRETAVPVLSGGRSRLRLSPRDTRRGGSYPLKTRPAPGGGRVVFPSQAEERVSRNGRSAKSKGARTGDPRPLERPECREGYPRR